MTITFDLGHGHTLSPLVSPGIGPGRIGAIVKHPSLTVEGKVCESYIPFNVHGKQTGWDVVSEDPWTLSPSLACRLCGDHGFIREGLWQPC